MEAIQKSRAVVDDFVSDYKGSYITVLTTGVSGVSVAVLSSKVNVP